MNKATLSMEVFPPKITDGIEHIYGCLDGLSALKPSFISVTYSAGNAQKGLTADVCCYIQKKYGIKAVSHLTCTGADGQSVKAELDSLKKCGVNAILALRGDVTADKPLTEYFHATDLMRVISDYGGFEIFGSCYPEGHMESKCLEDDINVMKMKYDLGARTFLSQLFFDNADFLNMRDRAKKKGVDAKIEAGIMPVTRASSIVRMVSLSGAKIPPKVMAMIEKYRDDNAGMSEAGAEFAAEQIRELIKEGVDGIHLYTMDNADISKKIVALAGDFNG
jgi:methylenetetrahydrofolate reductase (NADPH)